MRDKSMYGQQQNGQQQAVNNKQSTTSSQQQAVNNKQSTTSSQ
jgi:hypothetical protein